jgi:hypothetical protein
MGRRRVAAPKTMRRYSTGSDRAGAMGCGCVSDDPSGAALGPRTTGKPRITAASDGQPIAQVSKRFRVFAQVVR